MHAESSGTLKNKNVLVTGGTTGIGRATAKLLTEKGANVFIYGRDENALKDALDAIGPKAKGMAADQANGDEITKVFERFESELGQLDVLINNAAIGGDSVVDTDFAELDYLMRTNLIAPIECARQAVPKLKASGGGDIVNIGSMSAVQRGKDSDMYTATKSGLDGFTDSLRKKVVEDGIRVSLVEPGLVGTDMTLEQADAEEQKKKQETGEMLMAEDIARCVAFILEQPRRCDVIHIRCQPHLEAKE